MDKNGRYLNAMLTISAAHAREGSDTHRYARMPDTSTTGSSSPGVSDRREKALLQIFTPGLVFYIRLCEFLKKDLQ